MSTPDLFTVTEAAVVLRIGRTTAYELARRDLATSGGEGLAVVRIGGQLRIPRTALERITGGPVAVPPGVATVPPRSDLPAPARTPTASQRRSPARRTRSVDQLQLDA